MFVRLFSLSTSFTFSEEVTEWAQALACCLHHADIPDLDNRIEYLTTSLEVLTESLPQKAGGGRSGSVLGVALASYPQGLRVVDEARTHLMACQSTLGLIAPLDNALSRLGEDLARSHLMACETKRIKDNISYLHSTLISNTKNCLVEFMPSLLDSEVVVAMDRWCLVLLNMWRQEILGSLMQSTTDVSDLQQWFEKESIQKAGAEMLEFSNHAKKCSEVFGERPPYVALRQCAAMYEWFCQVVAFIAAKQIWSITSIQPMHYGVQVHFEKFAPEVFESCAWMEQDFADFAKAPLLSAESACMQEILREVDSVGEPIARRLLRHVDDAFVVEQLLPSPIWLMSSLFCILRLHEELSSSKSISGSARVWSVFQGRRVDMFSKASV